RPMDQLAITTLLRVWKRTIYVKYYMRVLDTIQRLDSTAATIGTKKQPSQLQAGKESQMGI
ncbi:MAG TPA: hypothetical protein VFM05_01330, partial [Candidatus Saccharimonadales bacterium]|nr:hypothetical protein [Candidatus Saccharimonadales bacterium]